MTNPGAGAGGLENATSESIPVPFAGGGAGSGLLTWGQRELWQVMERSRWLPIGQVLPLPAGTTVQDAVADLEFVMSRYPSMRTRLRFEPGGPRQVVASSGEIMLELVDAADDADPAEVAEQVRKRDFRRDLDYVYEWPLRMAVVRHRGVLTHRVWVMCHLVTDGSGALVILDELASRDTSGSAAATSALEQARWQDSPAGRRQCAAALRYWERALRSVPARRFPEHTEAPHPRYWQASVDSPATELAIHVLSARTGVEEPSVLLGLFVVAMARVTGDTRVVFRVEVGNRFRPGLADTVSPIIHAGLCRVDLPDATVDEALAVVRSRAIAAYKNAYYDPAQRDELVARLSRERGEPVELGCLFNDSRLTPRDRSGPPPTSEQIRRAVARGRFEWTHRQDEVVLDDFAIGVDDVPDTVSMIVTCNIQYVSPQVVEACVRGMEEVAVAAALDPAAGTRVTAVAGGPAGV